MKWKPFTKRLLSMALAVVMLAGIFPTSTLAAETEEHVHADESQTAEQPAEEVQTVQSAETQAAQPNAMYTYTLIFNGNGEGVTNVPASKTITTSEPEISFTVQPDDDNVIQPGYKFLNWNNQADGTGDITVRSDLGSVKVTKDNPTVTLYAQWQADASELPTASYLEVDVPELPTASYLQNMTRGCVIYAVENYNVESDGTPGSVMTSSYPRAVLFNAIPHTYILSDVEYRDDAFYCTLTILDLEPYIDGFLEEYETSTEKYTLDTVHTDTASFTYELKWSESSWQYDESNGFDAAAGKDLYMYHTEHTSTSAWIVLEDATCEEDGVQARQCSHLAGTRQSSTQCQYIFMETIPATGHTWSEWEVTKEATCTEDGEKTRTCSVCGKTETDVIPAAGHDWGEWEITKEATCTEDSEKTRTCSVCGETETEVISATGHDWDGKITTQPTLTESGVITFTCTKCGATYTEDVPALPTASYLESLYRGYVIYAVENYNVLSDGTPGPVKTISPSSSTRDYRFRAIPDTYTLSEVEYRDGTFYCTLTITDLEPYVDGFLEEYEDSNYTYALDTVHTDAASFTYELIWNRNTSWSYDESNGYNAAAGYNLYMYHTTHKSDDKWTIVEAATCEEDGVQTKQCSHLAGARQSTTRCQYIITETIPATGHTWDEWEVTKEATCTEDGEKTRTCSVCGKTETDVIPAAGHDWEEWEITKEATCTEDGEKTRTCSVCDETETDVIPAADHDWGEWEITKEATCTEDGEKTRTCSVCDETETEVIPATGHDWDEGKVTTEATCTEDGVKTYTCKNDPAHTKTETIPMKEHTFTKWESDETEHWRECTVCGQKEEGEHVDANDNGICDVCGAEVANSDIAPKTGDPTPVKTIVTVLVISAVAICAIVLCLPWKKKALDQ